MTDLLSLLSDAEGIEGVSSSIEENEQETEIKEGEEILASLETPETKGETENAMLEAIEESAQELYRQVTIDGLKRYRPDIVTALGKVVAKPSRVRTVRKSSKDQSAQENFLAYKAEAEGLMQTNPDSVSGRRLSFLAKKYKAALLEAGVSIPADTVITFVKKGSGVALLTEGPEITGIPDTLKV